MLVMEKDELVERQMFNIDKTGYVLFRNLLKVENMLVQLFLWNEGRM